jgi:hypothetical protein
VECGGDDGIEARESAEVLAGHGRLAPAPPLRHLDREQASQQLGAVALRATLQLVLDPRPTTVPPRGLVALAVRLDAPGTCERVGHDKAPADGYAPQPPHSANILATRTPGHHADLRAMGGFLASAR